MSTPRIAKQLLTPWRGAATQQSQNPAYFKAGETKLKDLFGKGDHSIAKVMWSQHHVASLNSMDMLKMDSHPLHTLGKAKWAQRTDPLWWNVLSKTEVSPRVVRSWGIRRTRVAFKDALKRKGFDENGYRLKKDGAVAGQPEKDLTGSVQFMINQGAVSASWPELNAQADMILERIMEMTFNQRKPQGRAQREPQQRRRRSTK